jgi:phosphoribosylformimino-5-aminoimidazole carboxamide ribotide isomerase
MTAGDFVIYPAVDLRGGQVVRLRQGDPAAATVYSDDPAAMARRWAEQGAAWLHVVNLDGALQDAPQAGDSPINFVRLQEIRNCRHRSSTARHPDPGRRARCRGATRVVLGTIALRQPLVVGEAIREYGAGSVVVALDAKDGRVAVDGWQSDSGILTTDAAKRMRDLGVMRLLYTDVSRDGMLSGPNIEATLSLAVESGLVVIASGGVSSLEHVAALVARASMGIEGAIIGQALMLEHLAPQGAGGCTHRSAMAGIHRRVKYACKRIIPVSMKDGRVVKGVNFVSWLMPAIPWNKRGVRP